MLANLSITKSSRANVRATWLVSVFIVKAPYSEIALAFAVIEKQTER
jgi:hypothetical protein